MVWLRVYDARQPATNYRHQERVTMKLITNPNEIPGRKHKTKPNPLENHEAYLQLRRMILDGKLRPQQSVGIFVGPEDQKLLDMKWPWRTIADRLRRTLKEAHLEADYEVVKYETDNKGTWFVRVTYTPPDVAMPARRRRQS